MGNIYISDLGGAETKRFQANGFNGAARGNQAIVFSLLCVSLFFLQAALVMPDPCDALKSGSDIYIYIRFAAHT